MKLTNKTFEFLKTNFAIRYNVNKLKFPFKYVFNKIMYQLTTEFKTK